MTHPVFPDCCTPWGRTTPSGRVEWVHSFACKVNPNKPLERRPLPSRAETASRAVRVVYDDDYNDYWSDLAFEQEGGR